MTRCPCCRRPSLHICPLWTSSLLNFQWPKSFPDCYVSASASPPSLSTWRPPQRCRRSTGMSPTLSYQAARTIPTPPKSLVLWRGLSSPLCYCPFSPFRPPLPRSDAAVGRGTPRLARHWGFRVPPVSYVQTLLRLHRLPWFCAPAFEVLRTDEIISAQQSGQIVGWVSGQ